MLRTKQFSFGGTAAIVTNMSLIIGLDAATATKAAIVSGLLILALADNLTDTLSIHIYQESEQLESRQAFRVSLSNFATRMLISIMFILFIVMLPIHYAISASLILGCALLVLVSYILARERNVAATPEIVKHVGAALAIVLVSHFIGTVIQTYLQ